MRDERILDDLLLILKIQSKNNISSIFKQLFGLFDEYWVCTRDLGAFFATSFIGFGMHKEHKALWKEAMLATVWCLWMERNARVFRKHSMPFHLVLDRIRYVATLWASANGSFKGVPLVDAHRD